MNSDLNKPSPQLIRHFRLLSGKSLLKIAKESGLSHMTIYNWENGVHKPAIVKLRLLAKSVGVDVSCFFPTKVDDLREQSTAVIRDYFSDGSYAKDRKATTAVNVLHIPFDDKKHEDNIGETNWRNRDLLPFFSKDSMTVKNHIGKPLVMVGPTRTGKTTLGLEAVIGMHFANYGMRSFVNRQDAVDLRDTIRNNIRELSEYSLDDPLSPISAIGRGGARNFNSLEINGGEMVLGGLNRDSRLLGTSFDVIFTSQLEQVSEATFAKMLTRCAGDAGNLQDENGDNYGLFLADCNPAPDSEHWILKYAEDERLILMNFGFENNPLYYDRNGDKTNTGETVIGNLDTSLGGLAHDLYFKGLWADIAGKLFDFEDQIHLIDEPIDKSNYLWYRGIDFGITSPSVCIWIGIHRKSKSVYVHREFRKTKIDTITLGEEINHYNKERIITTVIDNNETEKMHLSRSNISTEMTKKSPTSVMERVHILQDLLKKSREGHDGGIYFNRALRCNSDTNLVRDKKALSVVEEIKKLSADEHEKILGSDHGFDALTYILLWLAHAKPTLGFGGGGGSVKQQTRV